MQCTDFRLAHSKLERKPEEAHAGGFGNDLEALHHARHDFMFRGRIEVLGHLAHKGEIDVAESAWQARQIVNWANDGEDTERLAEQNIRVRRRPDG